MTILHSFSSIWHYCRTAGGRAGAGPRVLRSILGRFALSGTEWGEREQGRFQLRPQRGRGADLSVSHRNGGCPRPVRVQRTHSSGVHVCARDKEGGNLGLLVIF